MPIKSRFSVFAAALFFIAGNSLGANPGDPTSGDVVLFPGDLPPDNYGGGGYLKKFDGFNIPGKHFRSGPGWWVLACFTECTLNTSTLSIKSSTHPDYDGPPIPSQLLKWTSIPYGIDQEEGKADSDTISIRQRKPTDPILLAIFKPISSLAKIPLTEGPIKTWLHMGMQSYPTSRKGIGEVLIPAENTKKTILSQRLVRPVKKSASYGTTEYLEIALHIDGITQKLGKYTFHMEEPALISPKSYLMWAGDIDGDGKLDLLMNFTTYWWDTTMFLSSLAKPGELVGRAGTFSFSPPDSPGC